MEFKAAIFDVDGVIVDTAHIHHKSWREVLKKYGVNFTFEDFKSTIDGMPRPKGAKKILPLFKPKDIDRICREKQEYFDIFLSKDRVKVFKSTVNMIKKLKKYGIKTAMASSSKNAEKILKKEGIYSLFDADARGAYVKKGKPYPDIFLKAAKMLKVKPYECVVFEDAQSGVTAAKKAGMKCVGISRTGELKDTDITIGDMRSMNILKLQQLFKGGR
ncbi:MAG: HAD family hydrolase [Candidatus Goldiibacteriota bacterium]